MPDLTQLAGGAESPTATPKLARGEIVGYRNGVLEVLVPSFSRQRPFQVTVDPLVAFNEDGDATLLEPARRVSLDWFRGDLQKAVDSSDSGNIEIHVPPGEYDFGRVTVSRPNVRVRGAGEGTTLLRYVGSYSGDVVNFDENAEGGSISDLSIGPGGGTGSGRGAVELRGDNQRAERLTMLAGLPGMGVRLINADAAVLRDLRISDTFYSGIWAETVGAIPAALQGPLIEGCVIDRRGIASGADDHCIAIHQAAGAAFGYDDAEITSCRTYLPEVSTNERIGIEIWGGCLRAVISACRTHGGWCGISVAAADFAEVVGGGARRATDIGIEVAGSHRVGVTGVGVDCDGLTDDGVALNNQGGFHGKGTVLSGVKILNPAANGVHAFEQSQFTMSGGTIASTTTDSKGVYGQSGDRFQVNAVDFDFTGAGGTTDCVVAENTPIVIANGNFRGYTRNAVFFYGTTAITFQAHLSGVDEGSASTGSALSGGATLGTIDTSELI